MEVDELDAVADALPELLAPLDPLVQQWDRLSPHWCWMLILPGPVKVDLIFPDEPHGLEPPWNPSAANLGAIDDHFWDWMLWLNAKERAGKHDLVEAELAKLFAHLLEPLGAERRPGSIAEAVDAYRAARNGAEQRYGARVRRHLEAAVMPALDTLT